MKKQKTPRQKINPYFDKADKLVREITRKRDNNCCCMCGNPVEGSGSHPCHVYPKGTYMSMRWIPENIFTGCMHCHFYVWHENPIPSTKWFEEKYPERASYLLELSNRIQKVDMAFMEYTIKLLKEHKDFQNEG